MRVPIVALLADVSRKQDLMRLLKTHRRIADALEFVASPRISAYLALEVGVRTVALPSGPKGRRRLASLIEQGELDSVVIVREPLRPHHAAQNVYAIIEACDMKSIPVATNLATAEILPHFLGEHLDQVQRAQTVVELGADGRVRKGAE